ALVQRCAFPAADEDVVEDFLEAAHRRAADLFYGMHLFIASESGRPLTGPARLAHLSINELEVSSSLGQ
ncbi:MAG TPA: hypothetical protein DFM08_17885, partial [Pseudomonas sp.]|nr:hypothetical protein [Pseudomonas sp.]